MTAQNKNESIAALLSGMTCEMRNVMTRGHMDHFNTLTKQRNHVLQWLAGTTPAPALNIESCRNRPDAPQCAALFQQAVEENQALIQYARLCMVEARKKIEGLARRRQSQNKLSNGYNRHFQGIGVSAKL